MLALMLLAFALRLCLVLGGGQLYFPDESRYIAAAKAADTLYNANFRSLPRELFTYQAHPAMAAMALPAAYIHRLAYALAPQPDQDWMPYWKSGANNYRLSALFFALPSTLTIGMAYLLSRRLGAGAGEALLAAFLFAASNSMFIYSRHLLPYDLALLLGLFALWLALGSRDENRKRAFAVGFLAFLCFWLYHGYIYLYALIALIYGLALAERLSVALRRLASMGLVALLIVILVFAFTQYVYQEDALASMLGFAGTVTQGDFDEGAVFPFLYFRDSEGPMVLLWLLGLAAAGWRLYRTDSGERRRGLLWLGCLLFLYACMALLSDVFQIFVVYGRIARLLTPFIVLLCAYGFAPWLGTLRPRATIAFCLLVAVLALSQFLPALRQPWYMEFYGQALRDYGEISCELSFAAPAAIQKPPCNYSNPASRYRLVNAGYIWPITERIAPPPGEILLAFDHPLMLPGHRYESYTPEMRAIVEREQVMVQLIDTEFWTRGTKNGAISARQDHHHNRRQQWLRRSDRHCLRGSRRQCQPGGAARSSLGSGGCGGARPGRQSARLPPAHVSDDEQIQAALERTRAEFGPVDVLVNNAGTNITERSISDTSAYQREQWRALLEINLSSAFVFSKAVLPEMKARGDGLIVNIASRAGMFPSLLAGRRLQRQQDRHGSPERRHQ